MGSESNNMSDGTTSFQPSEPTLCANGCGFFGSSATMNMCSKCYRGLCIEEEQAASAKVAVDKLMNHPRQRKTQHENDIVLGESSGSGVSDVSSVVVAAAEEVDVMVATTNRCLCCKKKVGVMGFKCRCGSTFCGSHRYPEKHDCTFDFKGLGKESIEKANPVVKASKLNARV